MNWILEHWYWLCLAVAIAAILFAAQWPKAARVYGCPDCGKVFRISLAEYYLLERKGEDRFVDCRFCGREVWARRLHREL
jgi:hypothetical protein